MCALAALGTVPGEAPANSIPALSGPHLWPHNPLLRHSLAPVELEAGNFVQSSSNPPRQIGFTSCANESSTFEEDGRMTEATSLDALKAETDDDLLIRYQQADDQAAFAELDRRYHEKLLAQARHFEEGVLRSEAEDIVQEALLSFFKNRKRYVPKNVGALLHSIVAHCCQKQIEKAKAAKRDCQLTVYPDGWSDNSDTDEHRNAGFGALIPDRKADPAIRDAKLELDEILDTFLPPEQAEAVRLTRIEGHTIEAAGELLDLKPKTVHKRAERGIDTLKKLASTMLILFTIIGSVADGSNPDVYRNLCTAETDDDEVYREDSGHHDSDKQRRKSLMRLPIWPDTGDVDPNMTRVVNARHEDYDVLIARPAKWGNPFEIGRDGSRERLIRMYEVHIRRRPQLATLSELAGKRLGCYCKPEACHGDALVKLLHERNLA